MTAPVFVRTSEPWPPFPLGRPIFRSVFAAVIQLDVSCLLCLCRGSSRQQVVRRASMDQQIVEVSEADRHLAVIHGCKNEEVGDF
jgi:hypothetical protein